MLWPTPLCNHPAIVSSRAGRQAASCMEGRSPRIRAVCLALAAILVLRPHFADSCSSCCHVLCRGHSDQAAKCHIQLGRVCTSQQHFWVGVRPDCAHLPLDWRGLQRRRARHVRVSWPRTFCLLATAGRQAVLACGACLALLPPAAGSCRPAFPPSRLSHTLPPLLPVPSSPARPAVPFSARTAECRSTAP